MTTRTIVSFFCGVMLLYTSSYSAPFRKGTRVEKEFTANSRALLKVDLKIDAGEVTLKKSSSHRTGFVNIRHSRKGFIADIDYNKKQQRLRITVERDSWKFFNDDNEYWAEIEIKLPYDVPIEIDTHLKAGEIDYNLGDLRIEDFSLRNWAGHAVIDFPEENKSRIDFFKIHTTVGEVDVHRLGNANFNDAEINGGIGELSIDFSGSLYKNAHAKVDLDIGETTIMLPRDLGVKMHIKRTWFLSQVELQDSFSKDGSYYYTTNYDSAANKLRLRINTGIGELNISLR